MIDLRNPEPVQAQVDCRGEIHRLEYRDGELRALDHDDVDGELTLAALGGEAATCAELVDAWRDNCTSLRVLVLASRGAADQLAEVPRFQLSAAAAHPHGTTVTSALPMAMPASMGWNSGSASFAFASTMHVSSAHGYEQPTLDPLVRLFGVSRAIAHRLCATVIRTWTERLEQGEVRAELPALRVALVGRAQAALAEWATQPGGQVHVDMLPPGREPTVSSSDGLRIGLPFSWLADVWSPGLGHLLGGFTLAATTTPDAIRLDTLDAALQRSRLLVARA